MLREHPRRARWTFGLAELVNVGSVRFVPTIDYVLGLLCRSLVRRRSKQEKEGMQSSTRN